MMRMGVKSGPISRALAVELDHAVHVERPDGPGYKRMTGVSPLIIFSLVLSVIGLQSINSESSR